MVKEVKERRGTSEKYKYLYFNKMKYFRYELATLKEPGKYD